MKRDRHGRFLPKSGSRTRARAAYAHDPRTGRAKAPKAKPRGGSMPRPRAVTVTALAAPKARRRPHPVRGYYRHDPRSGRAVFVAPHRARETAARPRARSRAMMYEPRTAPRRRGSARMAPAVGAAGLSLMFTAGLFGDMAAEAAHRFMVTKSPSSTKVTDLPKQYQVEGGLQMYNRDMITAPPSFGSIGVQLLLAIFGFGTGALVKGAAWKFLFYGFGIGSGLHLTTQLVRSYIMVPMLKNTSYGQRTYEPELTAQQNQAATSGTGLVPFYMPASGNFDAYAPVAAGAGTSGAPARQQPVVRRAGQPAGALPEGQAGARIPVGLASLGERAPAAATTGAPAPAAAAAAPAPKQEATPSLRAEIVDSSDPKPMYHPLWSALLDNAAAR